MALDGGEWSASCPSRFTPGEKAAGNYWTEGWVGPRVGLTFDGNKMNTVTQNG